MITVPSSPGEAHASEVHGVRAQCWAGQQGCDDNDSAAAAATADTDTLSGAAFEISGPHSPGVKGRADLAHWISKYGPCASKVSIPWDLVRNVAPWALLEPAQQAVLNKPSG